MSKNHTSMIFEGNTLSDLYDEILVCLENIEEIEKIRHDIIEKNRYHRLSKKRFFVKPKFKGSFEEFLKSKLCRTFEEHMNVCSPSNKRMKKLFVFVEYAYSNRTIIHLSLSDFNFIRKCMNQIENDDLWYYNRESYNN